ncbi:helix-turn-helix domain-containing protein [Streptomyces sp. NPDC048045]|uniref:helix-turn-helix domain-containing protein n=1 Tax=Streptomyces sp. NPDC048045 TaxID=3154710 RepID=UPI003438F373
MTEHEERKRRLDAGSLRRLDARSLRGLAHPLRMQLLEALRHHGPATASQLGARLGESSGATSYHLRQLAAHGFVEDAPGHGKGRERWWQAVDQELSVERDLLTSTDPVVRGATDVFLHEAVTAYGRELAGFVATRDKWLPAWSGGATLSDSMLRLTPELAAELTGRMHALIAEYRDSVPDAGTPGSEQVRIHTHLFPIETD